jgi:hypothetical protein
MICCALKVSEVKSKKEIFLRLKKKAIDRKVDSHNEKNIEERTLVFRLVGIGNHDTRQLD